MRAGLKLPFTFDRQRLKDDLARVHPEEWAPHYNDRDYGGDWRGTALRSCTGQTLELSAGRLAASAYRDTPLLERCGYFREVLSAFACPLKAVRLLSLAPQSFIREHSDNALVYEDGELRIHVPVQTNATVDFYVAGEPLLLEEGHSYYVNVNLPHRVNNRGSAPRIHLVIDTEVNEWAHELIREARAGEAHIPRALDRTNGFEAFRAVVLSDDAIQQKLRAMAQRSEFLSAVVRLGRERGFDFTEADVDAEFQRFRSKSRESEYAGRSETARYPLSGWMPADVSFREGRPFVEWIYAGDAPFRRPFFEDDVRERLANSFSATFRQELPLEAADDPSFAAGCLAPSGFLFHMSRCGSTLVSQMLACVASAVVISEAPAMDRILQAHLSVPELTLAEQIAWTRRIVAALGQRRTGRETRYFIKLDSWHAHRLPLLRAAFPDTPWLFLFRDPVEVMLSQLRVPGLHCMPGLMEDPRALGLTFGDITRLPREPWCAEVLARICESAIAFHEDRRGLFVNYRDLPEAVFGTIARHFSFPLEEAEIGLMRERAHFHGKTGLPWLEPASAADEQRRSTIKDLCAPRLLPLYRKLQDMAA